MEIAIIYDPSRRKFGIHTNTITFSHRTHVKIIKMSILKSSIQPNGLKEVSLGNSIGAFEKLLRDEYQKGNVVFELDTHFLIDRFLMDSIIVKS